ncbi:MULTISPECIES: thioredoxin family protein [unclassified Polaribacter]|jgi:small redox-active disulfide protein 2|uniref:thioredoxin family protein n=1 Tax=unclassified Polaribacter TaxID=196858 RepID=UPI00055D7B2B|nr:MULTISPECIES: thioredoxin family protein [unclassified Polaribacter]MBT3741676.1 thioredoxin family protein [Polaribacter sp.]MBT4413591.1 thioredoxin family protein [Polaribacter sp.]MBT7815916.1 thioredoxin family protein [Polaribacter sp.]MDG1196329.1 thioredoxin family protein [Polaribacter sp.]MDG1403326.1 thioredoxin family protein [Polaribacter sp.]
MIIKILGTGCAKCKAMTNVVQAVVIKNNFDVTIEKIEDIAEILKFDIISTPALIINDDIAIIGRIPSKEEVLKLLNKQI